ncbi:hypothetical protein PR003_g937 [Phytophthora rubi]|uniref:Uncharacterized protein n=1 Tax=Phytophthora rubi TaxID=129364 RepID=A0A6A4G8R1_9STRA|nr:hypothetical protein PR002_g5736 [Phytophthora rubi]KAE9359083.1 hypothetical protein PR003_g937 [Phytophthora rubi]
MAHPTLSRGSSLLVFPEYLYGVTTSPAYVQVCNVRATVTAVVDTEGATPD